MGDKYNRFCYWMKTKDDEANVGGKKRVRRVDGSKGFSIAKFNLHPIGVNTQHYWEDLNGTKHDWTFYPEYAYLKKNGGLVQ